MIYCSECPNPVPPHPPGRYAGRPRKTCGPACAKRRAVTITKARRALLRAMVASEIAAARAVVGT
jgi:hypothetical protein